MTPRATGASSPGGWLSGGLDRATLVVAGVATLGLIMAVLDTTIVNVALDTLSRELHSPLNSIQWVSTGYLLSLAAVIPLSGWLTERFGSKRTWIAFARSVRARLRTVRVGDHGRRADRVPGPSGPRGRDADAGRVHSDRAERRAAAGRTRTRGRGRADSARADLRSDHRWSDRRQHLLAVDLRGQHSDRRRGDPPRPRGCSNQTPAASMRAS